MGYETRPWEASGDLRPKNKGSKMDYKKITMDEWIATPKHRKKIIFGVKHKLYFTIFGTSYIAIKIINK